MRSSHEWSFRFVRSTVQVLLALTALSSLSANADESRPSGRSTKDFAANSGADSQQDLQAILNVASTGNHRVVLPEGTFYHSGVLVLNNVDLIGAGASTILQGTNRDNASIILTGKNSRLSNLKVAFDATARSQSDTSSLVLVRNAQNFSVDHLILDGSDSVGIFVANSSDGTVSRNRISNTRADSIHITDGSMNIKVIGNAIDRSGDDGISVVSYEKNGRMVSHVEILRNSIVDNRYARGISVVGGEHVVVSENYVRCNAGYAGFYIASESAYRTYASKYVFGEHNRIEGCGSSTIGHGAVTIASDYAGNSHIMITANDISRSPAAGVLIIGGPNDALQIRDNRFRNSGGFDIELRGQDHPTIIAGNTSEGNAQPSIHLVETDRGMIRSSP